MKSFVLIFVLKVFTSIKESETKKVSCESFSDVNWESVGNVKTCFMTSTTSIDELGAVITPRDDSVKALTFHGNKKIFHLPVNVAETFPNLEAYYARDCSLKEVPKRSFNGLIKIKLLSLEENNEIEKISIGTFEGLVALKTLYLRE